MLLMQRKRLSNTCWKRDADAECKWHHPARLSSESQLFLPADVEVERGGEEWVLVKLLVISKLLAFHGAVCNVISCALQGMSQLVLGWVVLRHSGNLPWLGQEAAGGLCKEVSLKQQQGCAQRDPGTVVKCGVEFSEKASVGVSLSFQCWATRLLSHCSVPLKNENWWKVLHDWSRWGLSRAYTSAKVQQSPLIQSSLIQYSYVNSSHLRKDYALLPEKPKEINNLHVWYLPI